MRSSFHCSRYVVAVPHSLRLTLGCQNTFYCTESSAYRNKVLYFRQDDWQTLCQPLIERLASVTFEKLPSVSGFRFIGLHCSSHFEVQCPFGHEGATAGLFVCAALAKGHGSSTYRKLEA